MVDVIHDGDGSLARTVPELAGSLDGGPNSRGALFRVDQIRYLQIESEIGLEILRIHSVFYETIEFSSCASLGASDDHIRMYRWRGVCDGSPKPPKRSLVA